MTAIREEDVRRFRAQRWYLSRPAPDVSTAVAANLPLPASPAAYLALRARCDASSPEDLHRLVFDERALRVHPLPTAGAALVPVEVLPYLLAVQRFAAGSRVRRSKTWRRIEGEMEAAAPAVLEHLGARPKTKEELAAQGAPGQARLNRRASTLEGVLRWLCARGDAVEGFKTRSLFSARTFSVPSPGERVPAASAEDFRFLEEAALFYFRAAGPATRDDFLWWASLSRSAARHTIEDLAGLLEEVDLEGGRRAHFMLEEDGADLRAGRHRPSERVALVPSKDPALCSSAARAAVLCEPRMRPRLASAGRGAAAPLVLVGGQAVGAWVWGGSKEGVQVRLAKELPDEVACEVARAAEAIAEFVARALARLDAAPRTDAAWRRAL